MAPLHNKQINPDGTQLKQRKKRGPSKKEAKIEEEAQEVLTEKVSSIHLFSAHSKAEP
jgi:hypothetical protein